MFIITDRRLTGIYLITNTITGAIYVGSASKSLRDRLNMHRTYLNRGVHVNRYLQNAWNKYGESAFAFTVAEFVDDLNKILEREQVWIDLYYALGEKYCYNLQPTAGSSRGAKRSAESRRKTSEALSKPETRKKLSRAHKGKAKPASFVAAISKTFDGLVAPDGTVYAPITNLHAFARERGLPHAHLHEVLTGKRRSVKGWLRIGTELPQKPMFHFVAPDGTEYRNIPNLTAFCRENGLSASCMCRVHAGKEESHKGWRKAG